jgi:hypothetical protein
MANYYVTGVWKSLQNEITDLKIHPVNGPKLQPGRRTSENSVLSMYSHGDRFETIVWNYITAEWDLGQVVQPVINRISGRSYLRTVHDGKVTNNLDNIIDLNGIG